MKISDIENNLELYDSATFLTLGKGSTKIEFGDETKGEVLRFTFEFVSDDTKEIKLEWKEWNDHDAKAVLTNWDDPFGITLAEPMKGGTLFDREMAFIFSVRKIGRVGDTREITFSVYLGKEVSNG